MASELPVIIRYTERSQNVSKTLEAVSQSLIISMRRVRDRVADYFAAGQTEVCEGVILDWRENPPEYLNAIKTEYEAKGIPVLCCLEDGLQCCGNGVKKKPSQIASGSFAEELLDQGRELLNENPNPEDVADMRSALVAAQDQLREANHRITELEETIDEQTVNLEAARQEAATLKAELERAGAKTGK